MCAGMGTLCCSKCIGDAFTTEKHELMQEWMLNDEIMMF